MNPVFKPVYLVLALLPSLAFALGQTTRVSVDANGLQSNNASAEPAISADGRYVAFSSHASNLVSNDTNNYADIFVKDRLTGAITRASISSLSDEANADSYQPWISADGKLVAFLSGATSLVADSNLDLRTTHVYVHDMTSGQTTRVTVDANGKGQQDDVYFFSASADGRFVVFNAAPVFPRGGCSSFGPHIFLHDRQTAKTQCISVNAQGADGLGSSYRPMISADGNFISFESAASNLVPGDTNNTWDIFVRNRLSGQITRASVNSNGEQGNNNGADHNADGSFIGNLSADGRFVVFNSASSNLVGDDTNDKRDMFVHDCLSGATTRVSVDSAGIEGNGDSPGNTVPWSFPSISADGRLVSFNSSAANLVANDTNAMDDLFLHDRKTGITTRESTNSRGFQRARGGNGGALSSDGRWLAFQSNAGLLVPNDTNKTSDIFVRDRLLDPKSHADVALILTGPGQVMVNSQGIYSLTVTNNGNGNADNTAIIINFSNQGQLQTLSTGQGQCSKAAIAICRLGTLSPGQSVKVTATVTIKGAATINASTNASAQDNMLGNNSQSLAVTIQ